LQERKFGPYKYEDKIILHHLVVGCVVHDIYGTFDKLYSNGLGSPDKSRFARERMRERKNKKKLYRSSSST